MTADWVLVFMDENCHVFHREPYVVGMPLPQSPTWSLSADPLSSPNYEVKQFLELPNWKGEQATVYHTIINYCTKEFIVAVHGIYEESNVNG